MAAAASANRKSRSFAGTVAACSFVCFIEKTSFDGRGVSVAITPKRSHSGGARASVLRAILARGGFRTRTDEPPEAGCGWRMAGGRGTVPE